VRTNVHRLIMSINAKVPVNHTSRCSMLEIVAVNNSSSGEMCRRMNNMTVGDMDIYLGVHGR